MHNAHPMYWINSKDQVGQISPDISLFKIHLSSQQVSETTTIAKIQHEKIDIILAERVVQFDVVALGNATVYSLFFP